LSLLKKGAELFVLNRKSERSESSLRALQAAVPNGKVVQIACDLQNFASVRQAAQELIEKCGNDGLDVMCCNAGVMALKNSATVDGFDVQMQTNQLSHFLLLKEIFPKLKQAESLRGEARVVMQSSMARRYKPLEAKYFGKNSPELGDDSKGECFERYGQTKKANLGFVYALQSRLNDAGLSKIKAVCCAPGSAVTSLIGTSHAVPNNFLTNMVQTCTFQSGEDGAMPIMRAMAAEGVQGEDMIVPSLGRKNETKGPTKVNRPKDEEEALSDPKRKDWLWEQCERAIGEPFVITSK